VSEEVLLERLRAAMALDEAGDFPAARAALEALARDGGDTRVGTFAARRAAELAILGKPATPLEAARWYTPREGKLEGARVSVLVFFESWCPHCQEELPKLPELACRWGPAGAQVVALTALTRGATDADVQRDVVTHKLHGLAVGHEREGRMSEAYAVTGIPAAAVVRDGVVVWRGHPAQLDDAAMARLTGGAASATPCAPAEGFMKKGFGK
jgi:thiol-disulfide isomerase/thioredoxin